MDQEQIIKIQMMEQEVNQLNEQLKLIEQNVGEMNELKASLDEIDNKKEILANLGKRVYVPVEIKDTKLIVEVGKGNFVKKSVPDTKIILDDQIGKLEEGKGQIRGRLGDLQAEMTVLFNELQSAQMAVQAGGDSKKKDEGIEDLVGGGMIFS